MKTTRRARFKPLPWGWWRHVDVITRRKFKRLVVLGFLLPSVFLVGLSFLTGPMEDAFGETGVAVLGGVEFVYALTLLWWLFFRVSRRLRSIDDEIKRQLAEKGLWGV